MNIAMKKYKPALQVLKPYRRFPKDTATIPSGQVGFLSYITIHYLSSFIWKVYKTRSVDVDNIWELPTEDTAKVNTERLQRLWNEEVQKKGASKASLIRVVLVFLRTRFLVSLILLLLFVITSFIAPSIILKAVLDYIDTKESHLLYGLALVAAWLTTEMLRALFLNGLFMHNYSTAARLRGGVAAIMFDKLLAARSLQNKTIGGLVNLVANDSQRLFAAVSVTPVVIGGPFIAVAGTAYCIHILGWWALAGSLFLFMFYPYQMLMSKFVAKFRRQCITITDQRVRIMNEILTCIKLIKMYAWESSFAETVSGIRSKEKKVLQKSAFTMTLSIAFNPAIPVFASVITFVGHILSGNTLTPTQAFVVIGMNVLMRNRVINGMNAAMRACAESISSLERLQSVLQMEDRSIQSNDVSNTDIAIEVSNGTFAWDQVSLTSEQTKDKKDEKKTPETHSLIYKEKVADGTKFDLPKRTRDSVLSDINLTVKKASVYGICGSIGSGKSSLISSLLGQTIKKCGKVAVDGSIAYVAQQPWIQNTTVVENILFGKHYDESRYNRVLDICCLKPDLNILPAGDLTEIGERGVNLSGGQKQRISLARAVYSDCDIYMLDDPFAAVDTHVGQEIYEKVLNALKQKTIVLVTHQLQYLSQCDTVIMMKSGRFHEIGSHEELLEKDDEYAALIKTFHTNAQCENNKGDGQDQPKKASNYSDKIKEQRKEISLDNFSQMQKVNFTTMTTKIDCTDWKTDKSLPEITRLMSEPDLPITDALYSDDAPANSSSPSNGMSKSTPNLKYLIDCGRENQTMYGKSADLQKVVKGKLTKAEEVNVGVVSFKTYRAYFRAAGGLGYSLLTALMFLVPVVLPALCNWWLAKWLQAGSGPQNSNSKSNITVVRGDLGANPDLNYYVGVYVSLAASVVVALIIRGILHIKGTLRAASTLHDQVLSIVLRSPMSFFDTTPTGRIINRFSKDLDEADSQIPCRIETSLATLFQILVALLLVSFVLPWFLIAMVPIIAIFLFLYQLYRTAVREIKRADNVSRSPMLSFLTASVQGIHTISAFGKREEFFQKFCYLFDRNTVPYVLFYYSVRWFGLRLEILSNLIVCLTALLVVCTKDSIPAALGGLALVYASQVTGVLQFSVRMASEAEAGFTSIERLYHYIEDLNVEKTENMVKLPSENWPEHGSITFTNVELRYRPDLPLVLKDITCLIKPKEKIGVIGRTGAGKSSLGVALFRLAELSSGSISIDGQDISKIDLDKLRSRLSVIPQDPVLFVGTIRYNLDPFKQCSDSDLWVALEKCHVKDVVLSAEDQLDAPVIENGANFSVGEKQLICMARALLRHSKILLLDEATSAIDTETDSLVQQTIREAFKDCTLLTIAHRLNTIVDSDRIMVLEQGRIVEFDTPKNLMKDAESHFSKFLAATCIK